MARELTALVEREFSRPFAWGESDCCLAVANVLYALHRVDVAADYRGKYVDAKSAYRLMGARGVIAAAERETARLGWPEVGEPVDGDVGVSDRSLAIHCGRWLAKGERGLVVLDRIDRAWRPT